jgi:hypothetical protein
MIRYFNGSALTGDATHLLAWVPPYLTEDKGDGWWDLLTPSAFRAMCRPGEDREYHAPRDAAVAELAEWVSGRIGQPVGLVPATARHFRPQCGVFGRAEPVYVVTPSGGQPVTISDSLAAAW